MTRRRFRPTAGAALCALACSGCTVARLLESEPGPDLSTVAAGAPRERIERALGPPAREWRNDSDTEFRTYDFDPGHPTEPARALLYAILDVVTLGYAELEPRGPAVAPLHRSRRIVVSYDADGAALGFFEEFAPLPEDGRGPDTPPADPR